MVSESIIRDWLAEHLDRIEEGLTLVAKEFPLPNALGTRGFIDILAKDRFGLFTVIEVKRSDNTARQAIHELIKYIALLRNERGVGDDAVRCILASTHWEELEVPFWEYESRAKYAVDGYMVSLDPEGHPCGVLPRQRVQQGSSFTLSPHHVAYLFENGDRLRQGVPNLLSGMASAGIVSGIAVEIECHKGYAQGECGLYIAIADLDPEAKADYETKIRENGDCAEDEEIEESTLTSYVYDAINRQTTHDWDGIEIGYADKFRVIRESWNVLKIHRTGRLSIKPPLHTDDELLTMIAGTGGGSETLFRKLTSPRLGAAWQEALRNAHYCLLGNSTWSAALEWFASEVSKADPSAEVHLKIYNPMNMLTSLWKLEADNDDRYMPEMVLAAKYDRTVTTLHGILVWDGSCQPSNASEVIKKVFADEWDYLMTVNFHSTWEYEELVMQAMGLKYAVAEWTFTEGAEDAKGYWLGISDEGISRFPIEDTRDRSFNEFTAANADFLKDVVTFFRENTSTME